MISDGDCSGDTIQIKFQQQQEMEMDIQNDDFTDDYQDDDAIGSLPKQVICVENSGQIAPVISAFMEVRN